MTEKRSFGSCRAIYARRDSDHQYLDVSVDEAARLLVALQNVVGQIIASDRRGSEDNIRLWVHSPEGDSATVTVYRKED